MTSESMLKLAKKLARELHKGQKRADGMEYITHPIAVVEILERYDMPEEVLVAGMLHDICEDTATTGVDIRNIFTPRIAFMLDVLTKNEKPRNHEKLKHEYQKEKKRGVVRHKTFKEYIDYRFLVYVNRIHVGIIADPWIFFIKIADHIHNLSTLQYITHEKRKRKIREVEHYFLPIYKQAEKIMHSLSYQKKYECILGELQEVIRQAKLMPEN